VADDERKLDALLTEACGPRYAHETLLLVTAAMARVPGELRAIDSASVSDNDLSRLTRRIQNEFGVSENLARWSVATWAFALGIPPRAQQAVVADPSMANESVSPTADPAATDLATAQVKLSDEFSGDARRTAGGDSRRAGRRPNQRHRAG
jgi:hypothetical protein